MSDQLEQPPWMQGFVPDDRKGSVKWKPGMRSPNPKGRPVGIIDKRQRLAQALGDDGPEVVRVVVQAALAGDMTAAGLVLSRVAPPLKASAEKVEFKLSPDRPMSEQASEVVLAVAEGELDAETAKTILSCIQTVANIRAVELLEDRVIKLEGAQP